MKRRIVRALTIVFAFVAVTLLLTALGPHVLAQQGCASLRALGHGVLPTDHQLSDTDTWGGDVWGMLGSEFLTGTFTGNDGDIAAHGTKGISNSGTNGHYTFSFGNGDSFVMEVAHAVFNFPPEKQDSVNTKATQPLCQELASSHMRREASTGKVHSLSGLRMKG